MRNGSDPSLTCYRHLPRIFLKVFPFQISFQPSVSLCIIGSGSSTFIYLSLVNVIAAPCVSFSYTGLVHDRDDMVHVLGFFFTDVGFLYCIFEYSSRFPWIISTHFISFILLYTSPY
jgi:hypothetical protein